VGHAHHDGQGGIDKDQSHHNSPNAATNGDPDQRQEEQIKKMSAAGETVAERQINQKTEGSEEAERFDYLRAAPVPLFLCRRGLLCTGVTQITAAPRDEKFEQKRSEARKCNGVADPPVKSRLGIIGVRDFTAVDKNSCTTRRDRKRGQQRDPQQMSHVADGADPIIACQLAAEIKTR